MTTEMEGMKEHSHRLTTNCLLAKVQQFQFSLIQVYIRDIKYPSKIPEILCNSAPVSGPVLPHTK